MIWFAFGITAALIWVAYREEAPYSKTYKETRLEGSFSTTYTPSFERYLQDVREKTDSRFSVGLISPVDDLHSKLYHPELPENWQRALYRKGIGFQATTIIARLLLVFVILGFADSLSRVLSGRGLFTGLGTTGLGFRQGLALAFAVAAAAWLSRMYRRQLQTQGYLDGYSDCYAYNLSTKDVEESSAGKWVHWQPESTSNCVNPNPHARPIVGAIRGVCGQKLDHDLYLSLLADRFDWMLQREEDPRYALETLYEALNREDILLTSKPDLKSAGRDVIFALEDYLSLLQIPGTLPCTLSQNDESAERLFNQTDIESWSSNLLFKPYNPDR